MMDAAGLSAWASQALGTPVAFAVARDPVPEGSLTQGERERYGGFSLPRRREEWLRGRSALKSLLRSLGRSEDTSLLEFPHARLTLSHSAGIAVAAAFRDEGDEGDEGDGKDGTAGLLGIGVDFEGHRPVKAGTMRFFLSDSERARPEAAALAECDLLRLWTVKEALFKADPGNRSRGWNLGVYQVDGSLSADSGTARVRGCGDRAFRYLSLELGEGFLSLAVCAGIPITATELPDVPG